MIPLLKAGINTEIDLKKTQVWDIDRYTNLKLTCSNEFFFEALASNIKGSVISFQTFTKKMSNLKQSRLVQQINALKDNYIGNQDEIASLEKELNSIVNSEVLLKVRSMKLFSCLNSEKPTPIFLSLARAGNSSSRLDNILDDNGTPFVSDEIRIENIVSYYENIYKKQESDTVSYTNCIERFLGEELVSHPIVFFFIMYFGYLLQPPPPLCELARPAEWGFVYMVITGYKIRSILLYYNVTILINSVTRR